MSAPGAPCERPGGRCRARGAVGPVPDPWGSGTGPRGQRVKWKMPQVTWRFLPPSTQLLSPFFIWVR